MVTQAYAGTPLAQKLDLKRGERAWFAGLPDHLRAALDLQALGVDEQDAPSAGLEYVHLFCENRATLERQLAAACALIEPAAAIWTSWPVAAADLHEEAVRSVAASLGLAEVKMCALDEQWQAMKFAMRRQGG